MVIYCNIYFLTIFSYGRPDRPPRLLKVENFTPHKKDEGMSLNDTSVSHQKLSKQAITCKLVGIEMDTGTADARMVGKKKDKKNSVPHHPSVEQNPAPPLTGSQTPQHWFKYKPPSFY